MLVGNRRNIEVCVSVPMVLVLFLTPAQVWLISHSKLITRHIASQTILSYVCAIFFFRKLEVI